LYENNKHDIVGFTPNLTHYHRLVERFGLIEDIRFCLTPDLADVLVIYRDGKLITNPV
jgi:2-phosphosulfolactate phosphatase